VQKTLVLGMNDQQLAAFIALSLEISPGYSRCAGPGEKDQNDSDWSLVPYFRTYPKN